MRRLLPCPADGVDLDLDLDLDLDEVYAYPVDRPWLRANMVGSVDGAAAADGRSGGLSGAADKRLFGVLRGLADAVLVGAATVRTEGYGAARPKPAYAARRAALGQPVAPVMAVVTRDLGLDLAGPMFGGPVRTIVLTARVAPADRVRAAERVADVVVAGEEGVELAQAVAALHDRGLTRLLCEGGPSLLGQVAAAGLLDELCLSISPRLVGGDASRILRGPALAGAADLASLLEDDGYLFARYLVRR